MLGLEGKWRYWSSDMGWGGWGSGCGKIMRNLLLPSCQKECGGVGGQGRWLLPRRWGGTWRSIKAALVGNINTGSCKTPNSTGLKGRWQYLIDSMTK